MLGMFSLIKQKTPNFYVIKKQGKVLGHVFGTFDNGSTIQVNQISPIVKAVFDHAEIVISLKMECFSSSDFLSMINEYEQKKSCSNVTRMLTDAQRNFLQLPFSAFCSRDLSALDKLPPLLLYFIAVIEIIKNAGFDKPNLSSMLNTYAEASGKKIVNLVGDKFKFISMRRKCAGMDLTIAETIDALNYIERTWGLDPQKICDDYFKGQALYLAEEINKTGTEDQSSADQEIKETDTDDRINIEQEIIAAVSEYMQTVMQEIFSYLESSNKRIFIPIKATNLTLFIKELKKNGYTVEPINQTKKIYQVNLNKGFFSDSVQFSRIGTDVEPTEPTCTLS